MPQLSRPTAHGLEFPSNNLRHHDLILVIHGLNPTKVNVALFGGVTGVPANDWLNLYVGLGAGQGMVRLLVAQPVSPFLPV